MAEKPEKPTLLTPDGIDSLDDEKSENVEGKSLVVSQDLLPENLLIIPLHDRPMFPKMMGPILVDDPRIQEAIFKLTEESTPLYLGLVLTQPAEDAMPKKPQEPEEFFNVGVVVRVVQASPATGEEPLQLVAQALERFEVLHLYRKDTVFYAEVN